jgi:hypothetical protein
MLFRKIFLHFVIVQYNENTFVNFRERLGKKGLNKYLIMNIGTLGRILPYEKNVSGIYPEIVRINK